MNNINNNTPATALTVFNKVIKVEVSVDSIANRLSESMNPEFAHSNLLVNIIIGQALANDRMGDISRIFNALNGHEDKLDVHVGQPLFCDEDVHDAFLKPDGGYRKAGTCVVLEVNSLKDSRQVRVEYTGIDRRDTEIKFVSRWVDLSTLRERTNADADQYQEQYFLLLERLSPAVAQME